MPSAKKGLGRFLFLGMSLSFLWCFFTILVVYIFPLITPFLLKNQIEFWKIDYKRTLPVEVIDSKNRYIGYLISDQERGFKTAFFDNSGEVIDLPGLYMEKNGLRIPLRKDHKSSPVQNIPDSYWKCLKFLGDRHLSTWRNPFGIEVGSMLRMPLTGRGGSTISMQLVRSLNKEYPTILPKEASLNSKVNKI